MVRRAVKVLMCRCIHGTSCQRRPQRAQPQRLAASPGIQWRWGQNERRKGTAWARSWKSWDSQMHDYNCPQPLPRRMQSRPGASRGSTQAQGAPPTAEGPPKLWPRGPGAVTAPYHHHHHHHHFNYSYYQELSSALRRCHFLHCACVHPTVPRASEVCVTQQRQFGCVRVSMSAQSVSSERASISSRMSFASPSARSTRQSFLPPNGKDGAFSPPSMICSSFVSPTSAGQGA